MKSSATFFVCLSLDWMTYLCCSKIHVYSMLLRFNFHTINFNTIQLRHCTIFLYIKIFLLISLSFVIIPVCTFIRRIPMIRCNCTCGVDVSNGNLDQIIWSMWFIVSINVRLSYRNYNGDSYEPFASIT